MRLPILITAAALAFSACASSPRAAPNDGNSPPPAPAPDTVEARASAPSTVASPRDETRANIAGNTVTVDYGRPSMRGRRIFGELVPFDRVWRTGANEATAFRTSAPIEMNGVRIPAGDYTLYSLISGNGDVRDWTLIVNRQTGQWGTEYDSAQDLARIPMRVTKLDRPVEQFTIRVVPDNANAQVGRIIMMWERTEASVDFRRAS